MKKLILLLILIFVSNIFIQAQGFIDYEIKLTNRTQRTDLYCRVTPVGCIFNRDENIISKYKLEAHVTLSPKLYGGIKGPLSTSYPSNSVWINHDASTCNFNFIYNMAIGYGKYLIEFGTIEEQPNEYVFIKVAENAYCYIDYTDANYPYDGSFTRDIEIFLDWDSEQLYNLRFKFSGGTERPVNYYLIQNRTILIWHQVGKFVDPYGENPIYPGSPDKGSFFTDDELQANRYFPISATQDIYINPYDVKFQHILPEICNLNLNIMAGYDYYIKRDSLFIMNNGAYLKLKSNINTKLNILQNSKLQLNSFSVCTVEPYSRINLYSGSILNVNVNSLVIINPNAHLCNYGGRITGLGIIKFEGITRCSDWQDWVISDSTKIELQHSASWQLDSGSVITFEGNETKLILNPNSEIKFGKDSKLILRNGARLIASNATFTYLDSSNKSWDGIYLYDKATDTIINCTIENAVNGINIINRDLNIFYS